MHAATILDPITETLDLDEHWQVRRGPRLSNGSSLIVFMAPSWAMECLEARPAKPLPCTVEVERGKDLAVLFYQYPPCDQKATLEEIYCLEYIGPDDRQLGDDEQAVENMPAWLPLPEVRQERPEEPEPAPGRRYELVDPETSDLLRNDGIFGLLFRSQAIYEKYLARVGRHPTFTFKEERGIVALFQRNPGVPSLSIVGASGMCLLGSDAELVRPRGKGNVMDWSSIAACPAAVANDIAKLQPAGESLPHEYTFSPTASRRTPRTYTTKDGTEKQAAPVRAEFDALVCELNGDLSWAGCFARNEFDKKLYARRPPFKMDAERGVMKFHGADVSAMRVWLACEKDATATKDDITEAVELIARERTYHPIKLWLDSLPPASTSHLDWLAETLFGDKRPIAQEMLRKQLIASVARIYEPGCKVDTVLTLTGDGGRRKTTAIEALYEVPGCPTFRSDLPDIEDFQKLGQAFEGVWVTELGETSVLRKYDSDTIKSFITRREERYSPKWVAGEVTVPRQGVLWATTNDGSFLPAHDPAYRRRFWTVNVSKRIDLDLLASIQDQVWAEALALYKTGRATKASELFWFDDESVVDADRTDVTEDPWADDVAKALTYLAGEFATAADIFHKLPGCMDRMPTIGDAKKIANAMRALDHGDPVPKKVDGKKVRGWAMPGERRVRVQSDQTPHGNSYEDLDAVMRSNTNTT